MVLRPNLLTSSLCQTCPACGKGKLYAKWLEVRDTCAVCGLSFKDHDAGDGPAFFAMLFISTIVILLAVATELLFSPPLWVHMLLWTPVIILGSVVSLRVIKSFLIGLQYKVRTKK